MLRMSKHLYRAARVVRERCFDKLSMTLFRATILPVIGYSVATCAARASRGFCTR